VQRQSGTSINKEKIVWKVNLHPQKFITYNLESLWVSLITKQWPIYLLKYNTGRGINITTWFVKEVIRELLIDKSQTIGITVNLPNTFLENLQLLRRLYNKSLVFNILFILLNLCLIHDLSSNFLDCLH